jgi:hypothetical protein
MPVKSMTYDCKESVAFNSVFLYNSLMMNEKEIVMKKVTFLNAKDGKIEITYVNEVGGLNTVVASNEMDVAMFAKYLDFSESMCSSSMDFANEYGFAFRSGAWTMLENGLEMA